MESTTLVAAAFSVLCWKGTHAGASLPAPTLSLSSQFGTFVRGEWIWLECKAPAAQTGLWFYFCRVKGQDQCAIYKDQKMNDLRFISTRELQSKETFACFYKTEDKIGRSFESQRSNSIVFFVIERPQAPVLSLDPLQPVYTLGEKVALNCAAPERQDVVGYRFYKEDENQSLLLWEVEGPHEVFLVGENTAGWYSCKYHIQTQERRLIQSLRSNATLIVVRELPQSPELKIDPASGVIVEGYTLRITCSSNGNHTEKNFHFFKDGTEIGVPNQASLNCSKGSGGAPSKISLSICLQAQPNHTGEYTCRYEESMSGRWVLSPWSQKVNITVSSSLHEFPVQTSYAAWIVVPFLILLAFCIRRKNCVSKSHQECDSGENKRNQKELHRLESKEPTDGDVQGSEVAYAHLTFPSASPPSGAAIEHVDPLVPQKGVMYSEIHIDRAAK